MLMGKFRDGMTVTGEAVSLVLAAIDRVKIILDGLEHLQREPAGDDADLIEQLGRAAARVQKTDPVARLDLAGAERPCDQIAAANGDAALRSSLESGDGTVSVASHSIRVNIDTLDRLMTMVSELPYPQPAARNSAPPR